MSLLEIRGVRKLFGTTEVLRNIDLTIDQHQVFALIGASGSGKSTLLRCINGLERLDGGSIVVDGTEVNDQQRTLNFLRRQIGIVFQSFNLFPHMNVLQNVTLGPRKVLCVPSDQAEERARALIERVGLTHRIDAFPDQLSGGQQQRVAIVRALAMQPKLLLLDEITSALDPALMGEVLDIVRELANEGMTMLLATHEMGFCRDVATTVCFLERGVIAEQGPPAQIFGDPQHEGTREFLQRVTEAKRV